MALFGMRERGCWLLAFVRNRADGLDLSLYCTVCGVAVGTCDDRRVRHVLEQHAFACRFQGGGDG